MNKGTMLFAVATLGGAVTFYNTHAFISLICIMLFVGCCYTAGKLG